MDPSKINADEIIFVQGKIQDPAENKDQKQYWLDDLNDLKENPKKYWDVFDLRLSKNSTEEDTKRLQEVEFMQEFYRREYVIDVATGRNGFSGFAQKWWNPYIYDTTLEEDYREEYLHLSIKEDPEGISEKNDFWYRELTKNGIQHEYQLNEKGLNPVKFEVNDIVRDIYDSTIYEVIDPDKRGMAKFKNTKTNTFQKWNSCNNARFILVERPVKEKESVQNLQLSLF